MRDEYHVEWEKIVKGDMPYDYSSYSVQGNTIAAAAHTSLKKAKNNKESDSIYTCLVTLEGEQENELMRKKLKMFEQSVEIKSIFAQARLSTRLW